ncbi:rRNA maturation RNase YbeY [Buchnera aphidicola]|uniref:rRNA maturation RNase YbeY n=1 Tax=Buchnera aphidicola TaxID=9 RepID=UPI003D18F19F
MNNIITIQLVSKKEIYNLNLIYRKKPYYTNILAFPYNIFIKKKTLFLGDLVVCDEIIHKEAKKQKKKKTAHWAHIIIHGTLHLIGYTHDNKKNKKIMESIEIKTLKKQNFKNPYTL